MKNERKSKYMLRSARGSNLQRNNVIIIFPPFSPTFNIFEPFLSAQMISSTTVGCAEGYSVTSLEFNEFPNTTAHDGKCIARAVATVHYLAPAIA